MSTPIAGSEPVCVSCGAFASQIDPAYSPRLDAFIQLAKLGDGEHDVWICKPCWSAAASPGGRCPVHHPRPCPPDGGGSAP